jgi:hypothetical protein
MEFKIFPWICNGIFSFASRAACNPSGHRRKSAIGPVNSSTSSIRLGRTGQDQRDARFIDQGHVKRALNPLGRIGAEAVSPKIKSGLFGREIGYISQVDPAPFVRTQPLPIMPDGYSQKVINRAHPLGVATGQRIILLT